MAAAFCPQLAGFPVRGDIWLLCMCVDVGPAGGSVVPASSPHLCREETAEGEDHLREQAHRVRLGEKPG